MESGIKGNSDAIEKLAAAVVSQIVNDPNKIASMAAVYALSQKIGDTAQLPEGTGDLVSAFTGLNTKLTVETGQATAWQGNIMNNNCKKYGKICVCDVWAVKKSGGILAEESLFSLPWNPDITSPIFFSTVARNTANGNTRSISAYLQPEETYRVVCASESDINFNELRVHIVYIEK